MMSYFLGVKPRLPRLLARLHPPPHSQASGPRPPHLVSPWALGPWVSRTSMLASIPSATKAQLKPLCPRLSCTPGDLEAHPRVCLRRNSPKRQHWVYLFLYWGQLQGLPRARSPHYFFLSFFFFLIMETSHDFLSDNASSLFFLWVSYMCC